MNENINEIAERVARQAHKEVNQMYGNHLYEFHLEVAVMYAKRYIHLIPEKDRAHVIAGVWVHDVLEDTDYSYNDLLKKTDKIVAEYSYALQNEKGRTRDEKANGAYYYGIRIYKHATFIKLADRLANGNYSKESGSSMYKRYQKEYSHFFDELYDGRFKEMWYALDSLFNVFHQY